MPKLGLNVGVSDLAQPVKYMVYCGTLPSIFPLNMSFIFNLKTCPNIVRAARWAPPKTQVCGLARHLLLGTWLLPNFSAARS